VKNFSNANSIGLINDSKVFFVDLFIQEYLKFQYLNSCSFQIKEMHVSIGKHGTWFFIIKNNESCRFVIT